MSILNIDFHDKMRKFQQNITYTFVISSYQKNFLGTQKRV